MSGASRRRLRTIAHWATIALFTACNGPDGCSEGAGITADPNIRFDPASMAAKVVPGASVQVPVTAKFAGGVEAANLTIAPATLPPGVKAVFSPVQVKEGTPSTLTLTADSTAAAGLAQLDVVATETISNKGIVSHAGLTLTTEAPFSISAPGMQTVQAGTTQDISIAISRTEGFVGAVAMSVNPATLPAGATYSFPAGNNASSVTLRIVIPASAPSVIYQIEVSGNYGANRSTTTARLNVQDAPVPPEITLAAAPAAASVIPGGSVTFDLAFTRSLGTLGMGSFSQSVSGTPPGASASFNPSVPNTSSQLTIATTAATPDGTYPITVTATLGNLTKTATVTLAVVTPPNFSLSLNPSSVSVTRGASGEVVINLQRSGAVGDIAIDAQSVPTGVTVTPSPAIVNAQSSSSKLTVSAGALAVPGSYEIVIRGVAGTITRTTTLALTIPPPPPSNVTIKVMNQVSTVSSGGTIQIPIRLTRTGTAVGQLLELRSAGVPVGGNAWISPSFTYGDTATLNVIGGIAGNYNVAVSVALGAIPPTDVAGITVTPSSAGDFSILPSPQTLSLGTGVNTSAAMQIGRTNGFAGAVSFVAIPEKAGEFQVTFSLNSTTGSGIGMMIYATPGIAEGPRVMRIRATSGSIVHEVSMTLNVQASVYVPPYPYPYGVKRPPH